MWCLKWPVHCLCKVQCWCWGSAVGKGGNFLLACMFQHHHSCPLWRQMLYRPYFARVVVCAQGLIVLHVLWCFFCCQWCYCRLRPGPLKKIILTTIFHSASFYEDCPTTVQTKDATSAFADLNYHHSINVMSLCSHAVTETKPYCITIEVLFLCKFIKHINNGTKILNKKSWWVSNHETGL